MLGNFIFITLIGSIEMIKAILPTIVHKNTMRKIRFEYKDRMGSYLIKTTILTADEFKALEKAFTDKHEDRGK